MSDFLDLTERYKIVLLVNAGMGLTIGLFMLGAFISCLHMKTRRIIISELTPKTEQVDSLKVMEDDRGLNSPRMPRYDMSKDPEGQYVSMNTRSRSSSYPYFNRGPVTSFRLPAILQTTRKLSN